MIALVASALSALAVIGVAETAANYRSPLYYTLVGLGTVFLVLVLLQLFIGLFARVLERFKGRAAADQVPTEIDHVEEEQMRPTAEIEGGAPGSADAGRVEEIDDSAIAALAYAIYRRRLAQGRPPGTEAGSPDRTGPWAGSARTDQTDRLSSRWGGR